MQDDQYFRELLRGRGLKATTQRLRMLSSISAYRDAIPYSELQQSLKSTDRVTLYRTIETLQKQGIIHKAYVENNETYYALCGTQCSDNDHKHDHIHFKCLGCDTVTCQELDQRIHIELPKHTIHQVSIQVKGLCEACDAG